VLRDWTKQPMTKAEALELAQELEDELHTVQNGDLKDVMRAAARVVVRALIRGMRLKVVDRGSA
jgi:hypothetical protein